MKSYIIGIAGNKNSGKDTVASMINYIFAVGITKANYHDWVLKKETINEKYSDRIIHFADSLKDVLSIIYNIPRSAFDDRKYKDEYWYCFKTNSFFEDAVVSKSKGYYTPITIDKLENVHLSKIIQFHNNKLVCIRLRTLMQYFGTNICRNVLQDDIWIRSAMYKIVDKACSRRLCIVPDVRFANEAKAIKIMDSSLYGQTILINRDGDNETCHSSEIIDFDTNFIINNNGTMFNLFYKVLDICQQIN